MITIGIHPPILPDFPLSAKIAKEEAGPKGPASNVLLTGFPASYVE